MASNQNILSVTVPPGYQAGQLLSIQSPFDGQNFQVHIPAGLSAGMTFQCAAPPPRQTPTALNAHQPHAAPPPTHHQPPALPPPTHHQPHGAVPTAHAPAAPPQ